MLIRNGISSDKAIYSVQKGAQKNSSTAGKLRATGLKSVEKE